MSPRSTLPAALLALIPLTHPAQAADPTLPAIDALADAFIGDTTPGLGVLVTRQGEPLHIAGYGLADLEAETPVTPDSIFDLASVSKQMTALAARMQIEEGLYDQDTPIADLLPDLAEIDSPRPLTVGDLVHHLSGLTDYLSWEEYGAETDNAEVLAWLAEQDLDHDPGQQYDYSNSGYLTLGSLVAAADGADDLAAVLQTRIWDASGMADTALPDPIDEDRRVTGYDGTDGDFEPSFEPTIAQGDGNVFSTLRDLARYEQGFWDATYLTETTSLFTNGSFDDGTPIEDDSGEGYGYGWSISNDGDSDYAAHTGSWMGTSTLYQRNLTTGVTVILLANGEAADLWELAAEIEESLD
jgi:CubicO group peptidase (beta-lactamase class C family)